uniref:Focal AT domain-containing protein n=1 Tax=Taeniopygia guttata TaxID=59729 RepID=A0A674GQ78_TAEGU
PSLNSQKTPKKPKNPSQIEVGTPRLVWIEGTQKLLNKDLANLIGKTRLAQQNSGTSLGAEFRRQMLTAAHALAVDAKNLLDAVDQAKLQARLAKPCSE